jgi:hypothetical protein
MIELPIPVLQHPHWRVNFRPAVYEDNLIPTLAKCLDIIEKNKLSLRGWDFPHLSRHDTERGQGNNWIASWSDFMGHYEYWRFYQSGQFIYLSSVREVTETEWRKKLEADMKSHLSYMRDINWETVPGYISIVNFVYNITEIYEFAARLCQAQVYSGTLNIKIELKGIKGFVLSAPWDRVWHSYYSASENDLATTNDFATDTLVASSKDAALKSIVWFFERFGWLNPPEETIARDQEKLLKGRY